MTSVRSISSSTPVLNLRYHFFTSQWHALQGHNNVAFWLCHLTLASNNLLSPFFINQIHRVTYGVMCLTVTNNDLNINTNTTLTEQTGTTQMDTEPEKFHPSLPKDYPAAPVATPNKQKMLCSIFMVCLGTTCTIIQLSNIQLLILSFKLIGSRGLTTSFHHSDWNWTVTHRTYCQRRRSFVKNSTLCSL